jgi:hypothetical protein
MFSGIDRIMRRCLIPEVQAKSYDVVFTPVLPQDENIVDLTKHSFYIVEIQVHPLVVSYQHIHLLKMKHNLLYIIKQSVPRCKHFLPRL